MRPELETDTECYRDFWLIKFYSKLTGQYLSIGMWPGHPLDIPLLTQMLASCTMVTFNGKNYDVPMIVLAIHGANTDQMKEANDDIIVRKMTPWQFYRKWGIQPPDYIDNIDIMEVAPGVRIGLKAYMARCHAPTLQDLPYDPAFVPGLMDRLVLDKYCGNDLDGTHLLKHEIRERLDLRRALSEKYGIDLRSKSDAQIAEAVIRKSLSFDPAPRYVPDGFQFNYQAPAYIQYISPQMNELLQLVQSVPFVVRDKEEALAEWSLANMGVADDGQFDIPEPPKIRTGVRIPRELQGRDICIGQAKYRLGIGGLHSQESCVSYYADETCTIRDIDVKSYYPSLILTLGMVPEQLGEAFLIIYRAIYERRLLAKSEADRIAKLWECMGAPELKEEAARLKTESDGLKIVLNGTFGKLFSKWSILFAPELGIRVTMTGQLALLMLIEMMEHSGIRVLSANTDGIVLRIPRGLEAIAYQIVRWWETKTGLEMEANEYKSIHFRDVNNYVAITKEGKAKRNGVYRPGGVLSGPQGKSPNMDICADAAVAFLQKGTPLEETIMACTDIKKFIVVRGCSGGAVDLPEGVAIADGQYLGKVVRWYYGRRPGYIGQKGTGAKVAGSDWATPVMVLPESLPIDINHQHYIAAARKLLAVSGVTA